MSKCNAFSVYPVPQQQQQQDDQFYLTVQGNWSQLTPLIQNLVTTDPNLSTAMTPQQPSMPSQNVSQKCRRVREEEKVLVEYDGSKWWFQCYFCEEAFATQDQLACHERCSTREIVCERCRCSINIHERLYISCLSNEDDKKQVYHHDCVYGVFKLDEIGE